MSYRLTYIGLALIGVAALALGIALSPEGEEVELPEPVEAVSPQPGALVPPQTALEIDLEVGYEADVVVDGWPITITDDHFVEATGVITWSPSPDHPTINEWTPGQHTVRITYNTYTGLPDTGTFEWTFRVG